MGDSKQRRMTEKEYVDELAAMPDEQVEFLEKTLALGVAHGLSPEESADLFIRVYELVESGKSYEETLAAVGGKH
jgi:hypothetical protein